MASPSFFCPNFMFQAQPLHEEEDPHNHNHRHSSSILNHFLPSSDSPVFPAGTAAAVAGKRSASFSGNAEAEEEEVSDDCSQHGEKKRRLNVEQVRTLEKNFELGNKLEPERKMQLAVSLGLQPRQIAIWFQNRRARWKTKQLEKDYDLLKVQLQSIEAENSALHAQNKKLQAQISALRGRGAAELIINLNKETETPCSNRSENSSSEIKLEKRSLDHNQSLQFGGHLLYGMEDQAAFWPWPA